MVFIRERVFGLMVMFWLHDDVVGNLTEIPTCEKKKIKKTHAKEKQLHAQDNIYVVQQFACVHGIAEISLLSGKSTIHSAATRFFTLYKHGNRLTIITLITKVSSTMG